jgi:hypothetical protein
MVVLALALFKPTALAALPLTFAKSVDGFGVFACVSEEKKNPPPLAFTAKDCETILAGLNSMFPGWEAVTMQPPAANSRS